jgi:WD40 repeat protein
VAEDADWVYSVAFSPDDRTLASGCFDGTVRLCDVATLQTIEYSKRHANQICSVAFAPSGEWLASCDSVWRVVAYRGPNAPGEVKLAGMNGNKQQESLPEMTTGVRAVAFSPDGATLAIGDVEGRLMLWDMRSHEYRLSKETESGWILKVEFAPDGKSLMTLHGKPASWRRPESVVKLWSEDSGEQLASFPASCFDASFSPDGTMLATSDVDDAIRLWDVGTQQTLERKLTGHKSSVMAICFSPDGKTLATSGVDHTIKLWSVESGQDVATLKGHHGPVSGLAFSHDGTVLASSSADKTVRLWRAPHIKQTNE